jgi:hypothetical protein
MWQGIDKRKFPRADYICDLLVFKEGRSREFLAHTENIGTGGICTLLKDPLDKLSLVEIILYLKDGLPPVRCGARVVWSVKRGPDFDTGIEFINLSDADYVRIEKIFRPET